MSEKLSIYKIVGMLNKRKVNFVICILASIVKALFYGGIFTYEVKSILQGIGMQDKMLIYKCMVQLLAAILVTAMMNIIYTQLKTYCANQIIADIENQLMEKMNQYYIGQENKSKLTVLQNTVTNVVNLGIEYVYGIIYLVVVLCVSITYGVVINKWVTIAGIVISGILVFAASRFGKDLSAKSKESEEATNDVYGKLWEINDNIEILPFLNKKNTYQHLDEAIVKENRLKVEASRLMNFSRIFMRFSHVGTVLFAGLLGGIFVYFDKLTPVNLMGIILLLPLISDSLFQIPAKINEYHSINGMFSLIHNFVTQEDICIVVQQQTVLENVKIIEIKRLLYKINEQKEINIEHLCFEQGKAYGIYGESGTGKTTFLKILVKLVLEYEGSIQVNGKELSMLDFKSWWDQITYLEQESVIIPGSIKDNIVLDRRLESEFVKQAVHFSLLDDFMKKRANGDDVISLNSISSGEKQQICLARMFCQSKQVIIMDEATNALSPGNERMVLKNIMDWIKKENKILVLVSHNEEVLNKCDEIISF